MSKNNGLLVVFEGIDKTGKTTQIKKLLEKLPTAVMFKFPSEETRTGRLICEYFRGSINLTKEQLFYLNYINQMEYSEIILEKLKEGRVVLVDRYYLSNIVYSMARGLDKKIIQQMDWNHFISPDILIYLHTTPEEASKRKNYGNATEENIKFQQSVLNTYKKILKRRSKICNIYRHIERIDTGKYSEYKTFGKIQGNIILYGCTKRIKFTTLEK